MLKKMMMEESNIIIIGRDQDLEKLVRGELSEEITSSSVPIKKLKKEIKNLTKDIGDILNSVDNTLGEYSLSEITLKVEISASGKLALLGSGITTAGKGGIEFKFSK